jgi:hypothetical protein
MRTRSIAKLECELENERSSGRRQQLFRQIWRLRRSQGQGSATSGEPDKQPTVSPSTLSTPSKEVSRVATEQASASTAV